MPLMETTAAQMRSPSKPTTSVSLVYEALHDAAARRASALEYRQRVEATYAAYNMGDARPQDAQVSRVATGGTTKPADRVAAADGHVKHAHRRTTEADSSDHAVRDTAAAASWPGRAGKQCTVQATRRLMAPVRSRSGQGQETLQRVPRRHGQRRPPQRPRSGDERGRSPAGPVTGEKRPAPSRRQAHRDGVKQKSRFSDLLREAVKEENLDACTTRSRKTPAPSSGGCQPARQRDTPSSPPWSPPPSSRPSTAGSGRDTGTTPR